MDDIPRYKAQDAVFRIILYFWFILLLSFFTCTVSIVLYGILHTLMFEAIAVGAAKMMLWTIIGSPFLMILDLKYG